MFQSNQLLLLLLLPLYGVEGLLQCNFTSECEASIRMGSECRNGRCSNPFESGCLHALLPDWDRKRVCNSEDTQEAIDKGICRKPPIDYMEIRIFTQNWESVFFESWILQILLSEFLDVPSTLETGTYDATVNFYDPESRFQYGTTQDWRSIESSAEVGDCTLLSKTPDNYESCAHIVPEIWNVDGAWAMARQGIAEPPQGLGVLGQEGWFMTKFTGEKDPSLLNYLGLSGEKNRRKLAEYFLRPTTWGDYCDEVSLDNCTTADDAAARAPSDDGERQRMFVEGLYTGHFRKTDENDCDKNPTNCTGHIADYPCGWTSFVEQQAYHLDIAVRSSGDQPGARGYTYSQLIEIWAAANYTKSNVIMFWWYPDTNFEKYAGTDAEFTRITLPNPTQSCIEHRVSNGDRCDENKEIRYGNPKGACDDAPSPLQKVISTGLYQSVFDPSVPEALRSPGYEVAKLFSLSGLQLTEIFQYWKSLEDPRESICQWIADNDNWAREFIPRTYPREVVKMSNTGPLMYSALVLAWLSTLLVSATMVAVYLRREVRAMAIAQVEFLFLLLFGLLFISIGAIITANPATDLSCVVTPWFVDLGYTLEMVPLIVKVSAINHLMNSKMKRVVVKRSNLFGAVAIIGILVVVYLALWTALDPPSEDKEYLLSEDITEGGSTIVQEYSYCSSINEFWKYIAVGWNCIMLLCATVLAVQTRNIKKGYSESQTLAVMIYSHFVFVVLRVIFYSVLIEYIRESVLDYCLSIIFSLDSIVTIMIYFVPKLLAPKRKMSTTMISADSFRIQSLENSIHSKQSVCYHCPHCNKSMDVDPSAIKESKDSKEIGESERRNSMDL